MVSIEQWRASIGSFSCRGGPEEDEDSYHDCTCDCDTSSEEDPVKRGNHETVIEDELVKGGIEPNPGPGLHEMVSL